MDMESGLEHFHPEAIPEPDPAEEGTSTWRFIKDVLETLILSVLLFVSINAISARIRVDGSSMVPTLQNGEFVIVNKLAYKWGEPAHGDVVVFHFPRDPGQEYIKRVIGLPGDEIEVRGGQIYVNDIRLDEPYINAAPNYQGEWTVPADHLFVLGDNRNNSSDSHNWGPVPMKEVVGKAIFIYWPLNQWGVIASPEVVNAGSYP
ncbi:MAG: signal peptidase I [Anaerolineales bacterium]|nr:signal peptidase I [Anaerolineales bacterium]